jgi:hypothetical protein
MPWVKVTKEDKLALTEHIKSINEILNKYHNNMPGWVLSIDRAQSAGRELQKQIELLGVEDNRKE